MHNIYKLQRLNPDGAETLLDYHLATFDRWLQRELLPISSWSWRYYLAAITLLDQLDPKEYNWRQLRVILQDPFLFIPDKSLQDLFGGTKTNIEFSRIVSKFLLDRERARSLWVNSQTYADLARQVLEFMCDK